jgi:acetyltransferase-like isoleucine patch superfamily enzyme
MIELLYRLSNLYWRMVTQLYYKPQFSEIGNRTIIRKPLLIRGPKRIRIGARCGIRDGTRLEVIEAAGRSPALRIGDDVSIEQGVHIACGNRITIGDRVTIAARCTIVDISHPYEDIDDPSSIGRRLSTDSTAVEIGDECFIGAGAAILPNVTLGKHCVVGANSVVTKSMPDYTVCAGAPAKVIRRYDRDCDSWLAEGKSETSRIP